ncbi:ISL3 family transposase [Glutamicibacter sp. MNS18]|uniref:ISL3 family transposase n=1 Tax=Glutamicibacter sp. MNS18 TaxID=2989817 RepID=UPI002236769C|nr:ISL3 family transposase [Glutamicibacter sp. MNS18]MCW4467317.1 ISL3 family transposase [Glutamicibacter sp. MNS18]
MQKSTLWRSMLGVEKNTIIERVQEHESADGTSYVIAHARPTRKLKPRCGICHSRSPRYDHGQGRRRWRALDLGSVCVWLEAAAPRVKCPVHGITVASVPWARHGAGHTRFFDEHVAWLATQCSKSAVTQLMRVAWKTVGAIIARVWADTEASIDLFAGLKRIGIDEISYKKGHKYLTVVVCHDSGRLVWAGVGRTKDTLRSFFDQLETSGEGRCAMITHVSADGTDWIGDVVAEKCQHAVRAADPFHVVSWATDALDAVRRAVWNQARYEAQREPKPGRGRPAKNAPQRPASQRAKQLKGARHALWKNPENLSENQATKLAWIAKSSPLLHRAYPLKEGLRVVFQLELEEATAALERWIAWARRCRIDAFVKLQRRIVKHKERILASIEHRLTNGRIESMNTKIRLITRMAFGFRSPRALISMAMLSLGGHRPQLPGRI